MPPLCGWDFLGLDPRFASDSGFHADSCSVALTKINHRSECFSSCKGGLENKSVVAGWSVCARTGAVPPGLALTSPLFPGLTPRANECRRFAAGIYILPTSDPRPTPWAAFLRRFAAGIFWVLIHGSHEIPVRGLLKRCTT